MNKYLNIRVILIEKINNEHHLSDVELVKENWNEGKHPKQCTGFCKIGPTVFASWCTTCLWSDY